MVWRLRLGARRHRDQRRPEQPLADAVTLLQLGRDRPRRDVGAFDPRDGLVYPRIEWLSRHRERPDLIAFELLLEEAQHQVDALDHGGAVDDAIAAGLSLRAGGPLEVVRDFEDILEDGLACLRDRI